MPMYFKKFDDLTFADHYIFEKVLQNQEICKELLERLIKIKIDHIEYPEIKKNILATLQVKSLWFKDEPPLKTVVYNKQPWMAGFTMAMFCICKTRH